MRLCVQVGLRDELGGPSLRLSGCGGGNDDAGAAAEAGGRLGLAAAVVQAMA